VEQSTENAIEFYSFVKSYDVGAVVLFGGIFLAWAQSGIPVFFHALDNTKYLYLKIYLRDCAS